MDAASPVFEHDFDAAMLEQIDTLRTIRLHIAETMLKDLGATAAELAERGLANAAADAKRKDELRQEIMARIVTLRERLRKPDVVYVDEMALYLDLVASDEGEELSEP
jgi:hypothetical protein